MLQETKNKNKKNNQSISANPFLCTYRFKVQDDRIGEDDLAAWACIRLDRLKSGVRLIHLLDAKGAESNGALLVMISKVLP